MGTSGTEFADRTVGRPAHSRSLGGHGHLVVHDAEQRGFEHLGLDKRSLDNHDRLVREGYLTFTHRVHVAGESHQGEVVAEPGIFLARKEFLVESRLLVPQVPDAFDDLLGAAHHCPVVVLRSFAVEKVEDSHGVLSSGLEEGFSHRVLVLVRAV